MADYKLGGPLKQFTAIEKTGQIAAFLRTRMVKAIEGNDAVELHYLLATLDDYHNFLWRYTANWRRSRPPSARTLRSEHGRIRYGVGRCGSVVGVGLEDLSNDVREFVRGIGV